MGNELLKYCLEKGFLLDKEMLELLNQIDIEMAFSDTRFSSNLLGFLTGHLTAHSPQAVHFPKSTYRGLSLILTS